MITLPKHHTTIIGSSMLPHCTLRLATVSEASTSIATMPKFDGFQMCRPSTRSTYFDVMEIAEQSAYGQMAGERTSMPMLMPEMYELARCGHRSHMRRDRMTSTPMAVRMARN